MATLETKDTDTIQLEIDAKKAEIATLRKDAKAMHEQANTKEWQAGSMETAILRLEGAKEYVATKLAK